MLNAACHSQRNRLKLLFYSIPILLTLFIATEAHTCSHCERSKCVAPKEKCPVGLTLDECGCCEVCAKQKNERCKGPFGLQGQCGEGLECVIKVIPGNPVTGNEEGRCRESNVCPTWKKYFGCNLVEGQCKCEEIESCSDPHFQFNTKDECISDTCSGIMCIEDIRTCPEDSYKLPSVKVKDSDCCSVPQGCRCLPPSRCPMPECEKNFIPQIIQEGSGTPGFCCPVYKCINNSEITCVYKGKKYLNNSTWKPDVCHVCSCTNGVAVCSTIECDSSFNNCGRNAIPEGECCPVCIGCITSTGAMYNNSDTWQEDDCTKCTCENGQVNCQAEMCHITCTNPIHIPGQCCDICNETTYLTVPPECPLLEDCNITCDDGFQKDESGCYVCECKEDECQLKCPNGFKKDRLGFSLCKCKDDSIECPPHHICKNNCEHGFKLDKKGCKTCRCNQCQKLKNCNKNCINGFSTDDKGCPICKCNTGKPKVSKPSAVNCQHIKLYSSHHKVSWYDGCHNCICLDGREMCSLITCPVPHCNHPAILKDECCPKCLDDFKTSIQANLSVCEAFYGHTYIEGEMWNINSCITCICHEGRVLCETKSCPSIPCKNADYNEAECCPSCPETKEIEVLSEHKHPCFSENGRVVYQHGDKWRKDPCKSCICLSGNIKCFSEECPKLSCSQPLLPKNRCCPICPDQTEVSHCVYNGSKYANGEHWTPNECLHCECLKGYIKCIENQCPKICHNPIRKSGQCCPECSGSVVWNTDRNRSYIPLWPTNKPFDDDKSDVSPKQPSSSFYIVIIICGTIAVFFAVGCITLLCICCKQRQALHRNAHDLHGIHYGKPKLTKIEYQGINGPAYFSSSGSKCSDKTFSDVDYKSILGNGNQYAIKADKV